MSVEELEAIKYIVGYLVLGAVFIVFFLKANG